MMVNTLKCQAQLVRIVIQVNRSKHSISETEVMEQRIFSFSIKEQLLVMLHSVNDIEQKSTIPLQQRLAYV